MRATLSLVRLVIAIPLFLAGFVMALAGVFLLAVANDLS